MKFILFATVMIVTTPAVSGSVEAGACYTVTNSDARAYCRAKAHKDPSICYIIQKPDLRSICLAETR